MEFRLTYEGPLGATQGNEVGSLRSPKLQQKHEIRQRFHLQLKRLWDFTPFLKTGGRSGPSALVTEDSPISPHDVGLLAAKYSLYGWNFVPLVTEELNLICGLDILFLRQSAPGQLVSGGDLDNRLKTLFDALRIPEANERYADRVPDDPDEKPFYCLLADDKLITKVSLETDQLLELVDSGPNADDVRLVITVRLRPYEIHLGNMQFG